MSSRMFGRCTFTATCRPSGSSPLYTWPIDAAANGSPLSRLKIEPSPAASPDGAPSSCAMIPLATVESNGGTASCSWRSSRAYASGIRSVRILSACASLMKVGPSCVASASASFARAFSFGHGVSSGSPIRLYAR